MKRTTIFLPEELHEQLRQEAFRSRVTMAELIRLRVQGTAKAPKTQPRAAADPLLMVAGICSGPVMSANVDEELYGEGN
ncbi:MAG: CopG family transcriptional regulator [Acidobacteriota bacterium]